MALLVINQVEAARLLPMPACVELMERTLLAVARGGAVQPLRTVMPLPGGEVLGFMPSRLGPGPAGGACLGAKIITVFPKNHGTDRDAHQGAVLLFDAADGSLLAVVDATAITGLRTAAVSAVATRCLASPGAGDLAILGAGTQARAHLEAIGLVRRLRRVRVWSPFPQEALAFARRESERARLEVEASPTARAAVEGADIVCTVTPSREPVLAGEWVAEGAHINAVGASSAGARELDSACVARARLFVDRLESARAEAGDYLFPLREGAIGEGHILAELGEVLDGRAPGRTGPGQVTLFKSLGLAVEDLASARFIYDEALRSGSGAAVEFGGRRLT